MTRSLWVTNDLPPRAGGIEQFLGNLLRRLDPSETRVLASSWRGDAAHDRAVAYDVRRVGRRPLLPAPRLLSTVREHVAEFAPEIVVFGAAWPLAELAAHLDVPSLALTHGHEAGIVKVGGGPLIRHALRGVTSVGYISDFTRRALQPWVPATARMEHLPPGVDIELFRPDVDPGDVRQRHGIAADAPLVANIGRLVRRKGHDILVEAWPSVRNRVAGAHLLLGGSGPLAPALRRRIGALGLHGSVTLAGGVDWADLPAYHRSADVFAMPCRTRLGGLDVEGLGIVYLEAQASGVPVIAGRSGGAPEALRDGVTGLLVTGDDAGEVANAVVALLSAPERRTAMGAAGRDFVTQHYSWDALAARLRQIFAVTTAGIAAR